MGLENCWEAYYVWDAFGGFPINIAMDGIHHVYPFLKKAPKKTVPEMSRNQSIPNGFDFKRCPVNGVLLGWFITGLTLLPFGNQTWRIYIQIYIHNITLHYITSHHIHMIFDCHLV